MLAAEAGLARAQARLGVCPEPAAKAITDAAGDAATAGRLDLGELAREARGAANPVVTVVRALTELVSTVDPEAAEYVHQGSTSQDILDTAAMLVAARSLRVILRDVGRTQTALLKLAEEHRDTPMPGRTLALHAVPTTFGLKAAGWFQGLREAEDRVRRAVIDLPVQLGGAAGTMAGYLEYARIERGAALDPAEYAHALVDAFAAEVGLARPALPWHTIRTPILDVGFAVAHLTGALGKIAVDVQSLSRTEVGEVAEPVAAGRGVSSAMPHKRNPALATMIRAAALQVAPLVAGLAQSTLAEDERSAGVWHAEWQPLRECLRLAGGAAATAVELAGGLTLDTDRMRTNLELTSGLVVSERLAAVLAPVLGKAPAKELLSRASAEAVRSGRSLGAVLSDAEELSGRLSAEELSALLDPAGYTGAAGVLVDRVLLRYRVRRGLVR
jgi:3-carboxy-cis,cis-muconate cycloisomerase